MRDVNEVMPVQPVSLTHQHIFSVLQTRLQRRQATSECGSPSRLRILDIGCGDGLLISFLQSLFAQYYPHVEVELYGFDVAEVGYQDGQQLPNTVALLQSRHRDVDWTSRIRLRSVGDDWSFPAGFFDIAVSNQVLEHVDDLDHFLRNLKSCLNKDGFSVHLFPLGNQIVEGHTNMPFVHYIKDQESRTALARWLNTVGLSRYRRDRKILGHDRPAQHAEDTAEFIQGYTCYRTFADFYRKCNELGLSLSHHYTKDFYLAKLRQLVGFKPRLVYHPWDWLLMESVVSGFLKYVSSVTLTMAPINYDIGQRIRREKQFRRQSLVHAKQRAA